MRCQLKQKVNVSKRIFRIIQQIVSLIHLTNSGAAISLMLMGIFELTLLVLVFGSSIALKRIKSERAKPDMNQEYGFNEALLRHPKLPRINFVFPSRVEFELLGSSRWRKAW